MSGLQMIAAGVVLQVMSYVVARIYHMWWLGNRDWNGVPSPTPSGGERISVWIDHLGLLLIVVGALDVVLRWLHWI